MKVLLLILALTLQVRGVGAQSKHAPCFRYGPDTVRVRGTLARHMYYGAPGFGEHPGRDEKEVGFYLDLATSACTVAGADDKDVAKTNIRRIQLVLDQAGYDTLRPFLGRKVTLRGTLFGAISGHHHAPVLLTPVTPVQGEH